MTQPIYKNALKYVHMTGAATAISRSGRAVLHRVVINTSGTGSLTVYDNNVASGDVLAVINIGNVGTYEFGVVLNTGLTVVLSANADATIIYE